MSCATRETRKAYTGLRFSVRRLKSPSVKTLDFTGFLGRKKPFFFQNTPLTLYPFQPLQSILGMEYPRNETRPTVFKAVCRVFLFPDSPFPGMALKTERRKPCLGIAARPILSAVRPRRVFSAPEALPSFPKVGQTPTFRKRRESIWKKTKNTGFGSKAKASM